MSICEAEKSSTSPKSNENVNGNDSDTVKASVKHVGSTCKVVLQTAQAIIEGGKRLNVRVLFDSGSHCSFISRRAVDCAGLKSG